MAALFVVLLWKRIVASLEKKKNRAQYYVVMWNDRIFATSFSNYNMIMSINNIYYRVITWLLHDNNQQFQIIM